MCVKCGKVHICANFLKDILFLFLSGPRATKIWLITRCETLWQRNHLCCWRIWSRVLENMCLRSRAEVNVFEWQQKGSLPATARHWIPIRASIRPVITCIDVSLDGALQHAGCSPHCGRAHIDHFRCEKTVL